MLIHVGGRLVRIPPGLQGKVEKLLLSLEAAIPSRNGFLSVRENVLRTIGHTVEAVEKQQRKTSEELTKLRRQNRLLEQRLKRRQKKGKRAINWEHPLLQSVAKKRRTP